MNEILHAVGGPEVLSVIIGGVAAVIGVVVGFAAGSRRDTDQQEPGSAAEGRLRGAGSEAGEGAAQEAQRRGALPAGTEAAGEGVEAATGKQAPSKGATGAKQAAQPRKSGAQTAKAGAGKRAQARGEQASAAGEAAATPGGAEKQAGAGKAGATQPQAGERGGQAGDGAPQAAAQSGKAALEKPESVPSRMQRLRARLARSGAFGNKLLAVLGRGDLSAEDWEELEDTLLMADLGVEASDELMEHLRTQAKVLGTRDPARIRQVLREHLLALVGPDMDRSLHLRGEDGHPAPVLMVGVNGTGKTTTVGKLARMLVAQGRSVLLGAADTFRAAAAEQLATWGERVGVDVVSSEREGADPASVAFDAVAQADRRGVDVVLVDTAGRLQTKRDLMDELGKVKRVMEKTTPVAECLLVLDATTGQNGMRQAQVFAEVVDVTGIVLTKLDGSAKGGIVVSVQRALGVPVKLVGLGEGPDDLAPFDPAAFVDSLLAEK